MPTPSKSLHDPTLDLTRLLYALRRLTRGLTQSLRDSTLVLMPLAHVDYIALSPAAPPPIPLHPRHRSRGAASALFYDIERHISSMAYYIWHSIHYVRRMMCHNWFSTPEQGNVYSKPQKSVGLESWALLWGSHAYAGAYANLTQTLRRQLFYK